MRSWFWNCWIFTLEARKKFGLSWCSRGLDVFTYRSKNTSHHICQKIFLQASVAELFIENLLNILTVINKTNALARKEKIEIQIQSCRSLISPPDHSYLARMKRQTHLSTSTSALAHDRSFKLARLVQECERGRAAEVSQCWCANLTAVCTENSCVGVLRHELDNKSYGAVGEVGYWALNAFLRSGCGGICLVGYFQNPVCPRRFLQ